MMRRIRSRKFAGYRTVATVGLLGVLGCSAIIGVEDTTDGTASGGGESDGGSGSGGVESGGAGGGEPSGGASSGGSSGGGAPSGGGVPTSGGSESGGRESGGASSGGGGSGGESGGADSGGTDSGGAESGGSGGAASGGASSSGGGSGGMPSTSVEGRILDMFGRPLAAVQVKLSGVDPVVTDSSGNFSAADVPATYDAEFRFTKRSGYYQRTYRFLGLSRRDPTFEVADDIGEQEGRVDLTVSNLPAPMVGDLSASVGNPIDTPFFGDETGLSSAVSLDYDGSDPFATEVHALFWEDAGISSDFFGIASRTLAMNDGEVTDVILDSWTTIATTGVLSGHLVAPSATGDVEVTAFLNFSDGASIPLQTVVWNSANESFSLTVPDVDSATFSVLACFHDDGFGCAHADGFTIGQAATSIDLSIPRRPLLQSPAHEAVGVDGDTVLSWEPSDASPCSVVFLNNAGWLRGLRIVTCEPEVTLGAEILETYFSPGETLYYTVQSFGTAEDPDDLAGPNGLLDPYYDGKHSLTYPRGKNRPVTGILSRAEPYSFVVAY